MRYVPNYRFIRPIEIQVCTLTGQVDTRIEAAYAALDGVLHPNPPPDAQGQLQQLVADYASKSDWVHLIFVLDAGQSAIPASVSTH